MEISFRTSRLQKICCSESELVRTYGPERARILRRRLDQLRAAETLETLRNLPGRCHELTGDLKGVLSIDLDGPYRLLFEPVSTPLPLKEDGGLDWAGISAIQILKVEDTHA